MVASMRIPNDDLEQEIIKIKQCKIQETKLVLKKRKNKQIKIVITSHKIPSSKMAIGIFETKINQVEFIQNFIIQDRLQSIYLYTVQCEKKKLYNLKFFKF